MQPKILITLTTLLATTLAIPSPFSIRQESCEAQADACRTAPEANQAYCSAQYAACLGYNPYTGSSPTSTTEVTYTPIVTGTNPTPTPIYPIPPPYNGTTPILPIYTNETSVSTYGYSTSVVSSFSTYVPGPTTITFGSATYTATGPTTMTVSDCPCTLTVPITSGATPIPVPATTPAGNGGSGPSPTTTGPGSTATSPSSYVGAASVKEPAVGLAVVAMGALALLM